VPDVTLKNISIVKGTLAGQELSTECTYQRRWWWKNGQLKIFMLRFAKGIKINGYRMFLLTQV
jgi:hypothetical protein